jgi:hypothetical protein
MERQALKPSTIDNALVEEEFTAAPQLVQQ